MKKLVLLVALVMTTLTFAQSTVTEVLEKTENLESINTLKESMEPTFKPYVAMGLSIGDDSGSTFENTSYASVEVGVMYENLSFGAILGRNNLANIGDNETLNNYFYEGKMAVSTSLGYVDGYALVGLGSYFDNGGIFTEYGVGLSKQLTNKIGAFVQVSNWDGTTYVTPGLSLSL